MSNPLLKPGDPRFQQPSIVDAAGQNRFSDTEQGDAEQASDQAGGADSYAATPATSERPFEPHYETTAQSRELVLLVLAGIGLAGAACGASSLSGILITGWLLPLCAVFAAGPAWILAYNDLREMRTGGRDAAGRPPTLLAMWLGVGALLACIASVATMMWLGMGPLPDFL